MVLGRVKDLNLELNDEESRELTERFINDANEISGDIVLRAAKRGRNASELMGVVLSRYLVRPQINQDGRGVTKGDTEAVRFFRKGADAGDGEAMAGLGFMYTLGRGVAKDEIEAVRLYRAAMETGNSRGTSDLAWMYLHGRGVAKHEAEAVRLYRKAAEAGNTNSIVDLGIMYAEGYGVAKDAAEAVRLYREAVEAGNIRGTKPSGSIARLLMPATCRR